MVTTLAANRTVDEDAAAGLAFAGIRVSDRDDIRDPADIALQVTVDVVHGGLTLGTTAGLTFNGAEEVAAGADGVQPLQAGTYQKRVFRGTIADLNTALGTLKYYGDANFNTGMLAERLRILVDDLGNTDILTPTVNTALTDTDTVALIVNPKNDAPAIDLTGWRRRPVGGRVDEDSSAGLAFSGILVSDLDDIHDPTDIVVQVTLDVLHGGVELTPTLGVTYVTAEEILAAADGTEPLHGGTYQKRVLRGTLASLNTALGSLKYYPDANFNTAAQTERLVIELNDRGNTDVLTPAGAAVRRRLRD